LKGPLRERVCSAWGSGTTVKYALCTNARANFAMHAHSFHHFVVPLPLGGRLRNSPTSTQKTLPFCVSKHPHKAGPPAQGVACTAYRGAITGGTIVLEGSAIRTRAHGHRKSGKRSLLSTPRRSAFFKSLLSTPRRSAFFKSLLSIPRRSAFFKSLLSVPRRSAFFKSLPPRGRWHFR